MIIFGIIGAVSSVLMALLSTAFTAVQNDPEMQQAAAEAGLDTGAVSVVLWIGVAVLAIGAVVGIIAGVMGKKNWDNPEKGNTLLVWGIIAAVISVIGNILYATGANAASIISIITGLVLPVLYIIGVVQLKKTGVNRYTYPGFKLQLYAPFTEYRKELFFVKGFLLCEYDIFEARPGCPSTDRSDAKSTG